MKWKQSKVISLLIVIVLGAVVSFSVSIGSPALAAGTVLAGMAIMYLFKHRVEDIVEDERIRQVSRKLPELLSSSQLSALPLEDQS